MYPHALLLLSHASCARLCDLMDCSLPGSSVHGILQARIPEWIAMPFSRESFQPRDQTRVSCIAGRFFTSEPPGKPYLLNNYILVICNYYIKLLCYILIILICIINVDCILRYINIVLLTLITIITIDQRHINMCFVTQMLLTGVFQYSLI